MELMPHVQGIVVVEAGPGQLEDEMRLALSRAGVDRLPPVRNVQRYGGVLPQLDTIIDTVRGMQEVSHA